MFLRVFLLSTLLTGVLQAAEVAYKSRTMETLGRTTLQQIEAGIHAQQTAGHPRYNPAYVYVVDPKKQRMFVLARKSGTIAVNIPCGTGKNGLGLGDAQTPTGFFTMGGIRIAKNGDTSMWGSYCRSPSASAARASAAADVSPATSRRSRGLNADMLI